MRRRLATALTATSLLVLGACGSGGSVDAPVDGFDPAQMLAAAAETADEQGTAKIWAQVNTTFNGQSISIVMEGEQDLRRGAIRIRMDLGDFAAQAGAPGMDGTMEMLMVPPMMYMDGSAFGLDGWVSVNMDDALGDLGLDLSQLTAGGAQDFSSYFDLLKGTSDDLEELGREDVRGVSTTHLRATISMQKAYAELDAETRAAIEELVEQQGMPSTYPMEIWIDDDGLPRRLAFEMSQLNPVTNEQMAISTTMEFYDFGAEVDLTPPAEHTDLAELMGQSGA